MTKAKSKAKAKPSSKAARKGGNKTKVTAVSPKDFLAKVANAQQRKDSAELVKLMKDITGQPARMWGPSIVGFGSYHYVYPSGHEGDAPLIGFSPRKSELSLYMCPYLDYDAHKGRLGKHKAGAGCLYIKKLDDVDRGVLREIAEASVAELKRRYPA